MATPSPFFGFKYKLINKKQHTSQDGWGVEKVLNFLISL